MHLYAQSAKDGMWYDFQFYYEFLRPHKITQIVFIANVSEPIYLPNGDIESAYTLDWLNGYIDKLAKADDLAASLLIARGDSVFFERAFGFADSARTRPITRSTRFSLGSGNKMFTALAIMQLQAQGELRLSDTLSRDFTDSPNKSFIQIATIHHLLSQMSGLGDYSTTHMSARGHGGIAPGVNFELRYYPKEDITFVIHSNQDNGAYDDLRRNIDKLITGDR